MKRNAAFDSWDFDTLASCASRSWRNHFCTRHAAMGLLKLRVDKVRARLNGGTAERRSSKIGVEQCLASMAVAKLGLWCSLDPISPSLAPSEYLSIKRQSLLPHTRLHKARLLLFPSGSDCVDWQNVPSELKQVGRYWRTCYLAWPDLTSTKIHLDLHDIIIARSDPPLNMTRHTHRFSHRFLRMAIIKRSKLVSQERSGHKTCLLRTIVAHSSHDYDTECV